MEPLDRVKRSAYCGPTDESNWVLPGRLMVGAFPGVADDFENDRILASLLDAGVTTFVCLQKEYDPFATEEEWRSGSAIRPYFDAAVDMASGSRQLAFLHFGIEDCNVGEDSDVTRFAIDLANRLRYTEEVVYLHCWGGHGRTGTLVCLLLHLLYGLDDKDAFVRCQFLHDTRRLPINVGSPQTPKQREQVSRIISRLKKQPRPLPDDQDDLKPPKLVPNQVSFDENDIKAFTSSQKEEENAAFLPHLVYDKAADQEEASTKHHHQPQRHLGMLKSDPAIISGNKKSAYSPRSRLARVYHHHQQQQASPVSPG